MSYPTYPDTQSEPAQVQFSVPTPPPAAPAPVIPGSGLQVNPAWAGAATAPVVPGRAALPEGVYWDDQPLPVDRAELFRVNGRVYTVAAQIDPRVAFRQMRRLRKGASEQQAAADAIYDVLGDAVMDYLADEKLTEEQYGQVTSAVEQYMLSASKLAGLGKSSNGPRR